MNIPAGLTDKNIEYFITENDEAYVLQNGSVTPYEESVDGRKWILKDMEENKSLVIQLSKLGCHGIELEKKWMKCRFGSFDHIPDVNVSEMVQSREYHECSERQNCPLSGSVCKLPEGPNGKLSHREIETVKAIAAGESAKIAADSMGITFSTLRSYLKSIHTKLGIHNKAEITAFALRNNLL